MTFALALSVMQVAPVVAQQSPPAALSVAELTQLAEDAYVFRYGTYQALFIVTDEGVIATDPMGLANPRTPELYKAAIAASPSFPCGTWCTGTITTTMWRAASCSPTRHSS